MTSFFTAVMLILSLPVFSQRNRVYDSRYVQTPPVFSPGIDSCQRFYFSHYAAMDSVLSKAVANGDTAKYIRIYFSFIVDRDGSVYDARFEKVASTFYAKGVTAKTLKYFSSTAYYDRKVKEMMAQMPFWKPALNNGVPVNCRMKNYLQFWVGVNARNN